MKRYISAILIPGLLLQLLGCYSMREMTLEELKNYKGPDDIIVKTNHEEVLINRKPSGITSINWKASDSSITIKIEKLITIEKYNKLSNQDLRKFTKQENEIKYYDIESVEIEEINYFKTSLLTVGILILVVGLIAGATSGPFVDLSGMKF